MRYPLAIGQGNFGSIDGDGAITTNDSFIAEAIQTLRNYGSKTKYYNELIGFNSRLDEIQAAFLCIKLKYLDCASIGFLNNLIIFSYDKMLSKSTELLKRKS
jgi:dTDP-4-amino-4,6-dideoxygalactose transaminase